MNFFSNQIDQIFEKTELKFFVWAITLMNLWSALYWKFSDFSANTLGNVCWPIFSNCDYLAFATPYFLLALIIICALTLFFLFIRVYKIAFALMTLAFLVKLSVYLLNFSFSNNIQALIFILEICLFLFPLKSNNIKFIILLFLIWSGLSKLNMNWLSGLEIKSYLPDLPIKGIEWISAIVVILELVTPFILLSKLKLIFNYAWAALLIYFIGYSYIAQDLIYLYPAILIVYIIVFRQSEISLERKRLYQSYLKPEPTKAWLILPLLLFAVLQWAPGFSHPVSFLNKTPLSFQLRQVPSSCFAQTTIYHKQSIYTLPPMHGSSNGNDFNCHPSKYKNFAELCKRFSKNNGITTVKRFFYSKELTSENYNKVFEINFNCNTDKESQL